MSKFIITHTCGHKQEHQIYGPTDLRDGKADWLAQGPCRDCWKADKIQSERLRAEQYAIDLKLPDLEGSEKQIAWATDIRRRMIDDLEDLIRGFTPSTGPKISALRDAFREKILARTDSRWFIDNRAFGSVRQAFGAALTDWIKTNRPEVVTPKAEAR